MEDARRQPAAQTLGQPAGQSTGQSAGQPAADERQNLSAPLEEEERISPEPSQLAAQPAALQPAGEVTMELATEPAGQLVRQEQPDEKRSVQAAAQTNGQQVGQPVGQTAGQPARKAAVLRPDLELQPVARPVGPQSSEPTVLEPSLRRAHGPAATGKEVFDAFVENFVRVGLDLESRGAYALRCLAKATLELFKKDSCPAERKTDGFELRDVELDAAWINLRSDGGCLNPNSKAFDTIAKMCDRRLYTKEKIIDLVVETCQAVAEKRDTRRQAREKQAAWIVYVGHLRL